MRYDNYLFRNPPPKILKRGLQRPLGSNVSLHCAEWLNVRGIDIVVVVFTIQPDSGMLERPDMSIPVLGSFFNSSRDAEWKFQVGS